MRTGVLPNKDLARLLNRNFVCTWKNIQGEATCGGSYAHEPGEKPGACSKGDGEHNTQICIFTADGHLVDVMAGFQPFQDLVAELEWVTKDVRKVTDDKSLSVEEKAKKLSKMFENRIGNKYSDPHDIRYMQKHAMDSWTEFKVDDLVNGRGFGDHFFGRFDREMPGEAIGKVPGHQQASVDQKRCDEISAEARTLKRRYGLAGEKLRAEIRARLAELEAEYEQLKSRNGDVAARMERTAR